MSSKRYLSSQITKRRFRNTSLIDATPSNSARLTGSSASKLAGQSPIGAGVGVGAGVLVGSISSRVGSGTGVGAGALVGIVVGVGVGAGAGGAQATSRMISARMVSERCMAGPHPFWG